MSVLTKLNIHYANEGVHAYRPYTTQTVQDSRFENCAKGVTAYYTTMTLRNLIMCNTPIQYYDYGNSYVNYYGVTANCAGSVRFTSIGNGAVLQGTATLPIEVVTGDLDSEGEYVTANGGSVNGLGLTTVNGNQQAVWNTALVPNGSYQLQVGSQLGTDSGILGAPLTITVDNTIWFPNWQSDCGDAMRVEVWTKHLNGSWIIDIYDDQDVFRGGLDGTVDSNGLCILAGDPDPEPGFSLSLLDAQGNPLPSTRWSIEVATAPPGVTLQHAGGGVATGKAIKYVEPRWNFLTKFAIAYQQIFYNNTSGYIACKAMMDAIWEACNARNQPGVINGQSQLPFELTGGPAWLQLWGHLADPTVRNFFYFGHGGTDLIGIKKVPAEQITINDLNNNILKNGSKPFEGPNLHAYRFVFVDGCDTSKGDLCRAFGIEKEENSPAARFDRQGMRYRAFMGWKQHAIIGFTKSYFEVKHEGFIPNFFDKWADPSRNPPRNLRQAITEAGVLSDGITPWSEIQNLKVYGYEGLLWQDTFP